MTNARSIEADMLGRSSMKHLSKDCLQRRPVGRADASRAFFEALVKRCVCVCVCVCVELPDEVLTGEERRRGLVG